MASASFLFVLSPVQTAQATQGFPLYTWGNGGGASIGRPSTAESPFYAPGRVGNANNWIQAAAGDNGSFAINIYGELFGWGGSWAADKMGQGAHPNPGVGSITVPTQIGTETNWAMVTSRLHNVGAINENGEIFAWGASNGANVPTKIQGTPDNWTYLSAGNFGFFAINSDGFLYSWGDLAGAGLLGRDTTAVSHDVPGRVVIAGQPNATWKTVSIGASAVVAVTEDGELFSWGTAFLGRPTGAAHPDSAPGNRPGRVGVADSWIGARDNWVSVAVGTNFAAALNEDGVVYTWGSSANGQLGRPIDAAHPDNAPALRPGAIVDNNGVPIDKFVSIFGGANFTLAFTNTNELMSWGNNGGGQLGIGEPGGYRNRPTHVAYIARFTGASKGGGQTTAKLFEIREVMTDISLYKHLEKPYGTPAPNLTFNFTMVARSFNDSSAANFTTNFPTGSANMTHSITIDAASPAYPTSPSAGDRVTLSGCTDILEGIAFDRRGVFAWTIAEVQTTPVVTPPSNLIFSQAQYELRVYVREEAGALGDFYIYAVTLHRIQNADGSTPAEPIKVNDLTFTNQYTRVTAANQHFEIGKTIEGDFADLSDTFTFEITLTRTALCPENRTFVGRVVDVAGNPVSPPRTYTFTTGVTQNVELGHNERLIFDGANALTLGSTFLVVEQACPFHIASVRVYSYGTHQPPNPPNYVVLANTEPDQARTTNTHTIGANRNAALFTNTHQMPPPTGLIIGNAPYALVLAAGMMFAVLLATKARKRIEDLPTVH